MSEKSSEKQIYSRTIKSFARRSRGVTERQKQAFTQYWSAYGLQPEGLLEFSAIFKREAATILEIGFGNGETLVETAIQYPQYNFIGIEVHRAGIGNVLQSVVDHQLSNLRVMEGDAVQFLSHHFRDHSLAATHIFFPDPWPKKRHHKRRLIQVEFVQMLTCKLQKNGILHLATDWENYAEHMQEVLEEFPLLRMIDAQTDTVSLNRLTTKFERRGLKLGHEVWDLIYRNAGETNIT